MEFNEIIQLIQERGHRLTSARKQVIRVLCSHSGFLGAYDIHHQLEEEGVHIGVASIYRVLGMLKTLGILRSEEFSTGGEKFRLEPKHSHPHQHSHQLICSQCGRTEEWAGECPISNVTRKLESDSGFQIEDHWLRFFGVCPHCQD
jgi:Fur family zinc uptake transcriptional regulator/Fur family ferric uptake transcriptional regulator